MPSCWRNFIGQGSCAQQVQDGQGPPPQPHRVQTCCLQFHPFHPGGLLIAQGGDKRLESAELCFTRKYKAAGSLRPPWPLSSLVCFPRQTLLFRQPSFCKLLLEMGDYSSPPAGYVLRRNGTCTETEQTCDHPWASWYNCCPEGSYCSDDRMICCQIKSGCAAQGRSSLRKQCDLGFILQRRFLLLLPAREAGLCGNIPR